MKLNLFPRDTKFFDLFSATMTKAVRAVELLLDLMVDFTSVVEKSRRIKEIEHECDTLGHEVNRLVNQSFVTPIDREDIYALAASMDDVVDFTEAVADSVVLYSLHQPNAAMIAMTETLLRTVKVLKQAVDLLPHYQKLAPYWIEVHSLENEGDDTYRKAIALLFADSKGNPLEILKLKEIYDMLEEALDKCEDVADVIQNIVIKNA
jgi:predicted phosphate transport protein (TIGR00153 family)